jgi:hypothetical protein
MPAKFSNKERAGNAEPLWEIIPGGGACVRGVPMHLLTQRGLTEAFIGVVEEHKRSGRPVVTARNGSKRCELVPAVDLEDEVREARKQVVELSIEIDRLRAAYCARKEAEAAHSTAR